MALHFSTKLKIDWLFGGGKDLGTLLALGQLDILKGTRPTATTGKTDSADKVFASYATDLLVSITLAGGATGVSFTTPAALGVLSKTGVWSGTIGANAGSGGSVATWFRYHLYADAGANSYSADTTTYYRIDGNVGMTGGTDIDLYLANSTLVTANILTIDVFQITI